MAAVAGIGERAYSPEEAAIARRGHFGRKFGTNFAVSAARRRPKSGKELESRKAGSPVHRFWPPRAAWDRGWGEGVPGCCSLSGCPPLAECSGRKAHPSMMDPTAVWRVEGGRGIWECIRRANNPLNKPTHQPAKSPPSPLILCVLVTR